LTFLRASPFHGEAFDLRKESFPAGAVIAVCELMACRQVDDPLIVAGSRLELAFGDYTAGRWAWFLENIRRIKPVPTRGRQMLWDWEGEVIVLK